MKIRVLVVRVGQPPVVETIDNEDLHAMQKIVGGYIERGCFLDRGIALYCNEEGLLKDLPANPAYVQVASTVLKNRIPPVIVGDVFITREHPPNLVDLTDEDIEKWSKLFNATE